MGNLLKINDDIMTVQAIVCGSGLFGFLYEDNTIFSCFVRLYPYICITRFLNKDIIHIFLSSPPEIRHYK